MPSLFSNRELVTAALIALALLSMVLQSDLLEASSSPIRERKLDQAELFEKGFGAVIGHEEWLRRSDQHGTGNVILARVLTSKRCRMVTDPADAKLFLVPLIFPPYREMTPEEMGKVYDFMPPADEERLWNVCDRVAKENWRARLTHWTPANARRHILIPADYFDMSGFCEGVDASWNYRIESDRLNAELLAAMPTITTGMMHNEFRSQQGVHGAMAAQRFVSAPLVSSVHTSPDGPLPWKPKPESARPWLMSYGGSTEGAPRASALRKLLVTKCKEYGNTTCRLVTAYQMDNEVTLADAFKSKRESVFCLEPPGFGEHRKSQVDALNLGCIPVMFAPQADEVLWPLHWGPFRDESRVLIDMDKVLDGTVDVLSVLRAIPRERVRAMQRAIGLHADRMHYASKDMPGDAIEILFRELDRLASSDDSKARSELHTSCADAWPNLGSALRERLGRDVRWQHAPRSCAELIASNWSCTDAVPTRKPGAFVRHFCLKTCGGCTPPP